MHEARLALAEITNRANSNEHNEDTQKPLFKGTVITMFSLVDVEKQYGGLEKSCDITMASLMLINNLTENLHPVEVPSSTATTGY